MRPAGQAKAGFYPTPATVMQRIAAHIAPTDPAGITRAIDPCAGEGAAMRQLQDMIRGMTTYGIELDSDRAAEARQQLDNVITGDYFTARTKADAYSLLFLNPPYDFSGDDDRRLEHKFLITKTPDLLTTGGLLVLVIPQVRLIKQTCRHLAAYYENIRVYKFQEPEYQAFNQIVIFGTRKLDNTPNPRAQEELEHVSTAFNMLDPAQPSLLPELPRPDAPVYVLPSTPQDQPFYFIGEHVDPEEAYRIIQVKGIWADTRKLDEIFAPKEAPTIRPLMPLKKGHLALLIASGFINNQILDDNQGTRLIIKGRSFKASHTERNTKTEQTDDGKEKEVTEITEKEKFNTVISAFNLNTGQFMAIK